MDKIVYIYPFITLFKTHWNSAEAIGEVDVPILFIRSLKDYFILPYHMRQLMKKATKSRLCMDYPVENGAHMAIWYLNPTVYASKINKFFLAAENHQEVKS